MNLLFLTFVFPLIGFLALAGSRGRWPEHRVALIGAGSMGLSAATVVWVGGHFLAENSEVGFYTQTLWVWMRVENFAPAFSLRLDGLALTMIAVVTGVGFLIHLFAAWYMRGEEGYSRFFAYMNLFVTAMLLLVLGDNLLLVYLGWEGVGLCSYLLIGFYYREPANLAAAMKAFVVTRIGDIFMVIALLLLISHFGTLDIQVLLTLLQQQETPGSALVNLAALLLLGGAVGKSAQLPLQTWLADAMAGPTPVSALIHAATMVTAGVYLITRMQGLYLLAPEVLELVGVIGATTLLLAGFSALVQTDIKRILAYSTMSQIGYMFLALGVGAWNAAIFHLMIHAFFKALLFLAAGAVILACHHEQDIFKMGGLRKRLPFLYACFWVGGGSLAALPFVTAGFYSKHEILWQALASHHWGFLIAGLVGALLTVLYTFRLIFVVFHGEASRAEVRGGQGIAYFLPLSVLLLLSTFVGALIHPPLAGVPREEMDYAGVQAHQMLEIVSGILVVFGILLSMLLFLGKRRLVGRLSRGTLGKLLIHWWYNAWGFDGLYDRVFVQPMLWLQGLLRNDAAHLIVVLIINITHLGHTALTRSENGRIRWYAAWMAGGAAMLMWLAIS
ncbi:MAG: NADH-quinone oxidoreductase subunit L [Pseudomonadota bacterium]